MNGEFVLLLTLRALRLILFKSKKNLYLVMKGKWLECVLAIQKIIAAEKCISLDVPTSQYDAILLRAWI